MKNFLKQLGLFVVCSLAFATTYAFAASTPSSSFGPQFVGPPSVPSIQFRTSNQITTCVGDGGFTNCLNSPQVISTATVQSVVNPTNGTILFNLDGGNGDQAVLTGQAANPADGGAYLPGLTATTQLICQLQNPVVAGTAAAFAIASGYAGTGCTAVTQAPGGDGGVVLVSCGIPWLGTDGGQVSCIRVN